IPADRLDEAGAAGADMGRLLRRVEEQLDRAAVNDRAVLFRLAASACRTGRVRWAELPILLPDVPLDSVVEREFVGALAARTPELFATVADGDRAALDALANLGAIPETVGEGETSDLAALRRFIF